MINLYYDDKSQIYFWNDLNKECDGCHNIIDEYVIIRVFWDRLGSGINYFCSKCINKLKLSSKASYIETYIALVTDDVSSHSVPVLFTKPSTQPSSNLTVFDIADIQNKLGGKIVDRTVFSGRDNDILIIADHSKFIQDLEIKDSEILDDEGFNKIIYDLKNSSIISYDGRILINHKDKDNKV